MNQQIKIIHYWQLSGSMVLFICGFAIAWLPMLSLSYPIPAIICMPLSALCLILGVCKLRKSRSTLQLNSEHLCLNINQTTLCIPWKNIRLIEPLEGRIGSHGIKLALHQIDPLLQSLDPSSIRLLLLELRRTLQYLFPHQKRQSEFLIEPSQFCSNTGIEYHGAQAMLGARMQKLQRLTGFELPLGPLPISQKRVDELNAILQQTNHLAPH